jgi:hypothetical protein
MRAEVSQLVDASSSPVALAHCAQALHAVCDDAGEAPVCCEVADHEEEARRVLLVAPVAAPSLLGQLVWAPGRVHCEVHALPQVGCAPALTVQADASRGCRGDDGDELAPCLEVGGLAQVVLSAQPVLARGRRCARSSCTWLCDPHWRKGRVHCGCLPAAAAPLSMPAALRPALLFPSVLWLAMPVPQQWPRSCCC